MTIRHPWPDISIAQWSGTCAALHLWCQIVGKYRLSQTPWMNHSWHATLYVTPRGLTTGPVHETGGCLTVTLDLVDHRAEVQADDGTHAGFALGAMSVAQFRSQLAEAVTQVGGTFDIHGAPNELPAATPFAQDTANRPYDADAVTRFHGALLRMVPVFEHFRTGFLGKSSPVHLFWGSFDLAATRFSGRTAPPHPGGIPNLPDAVTHEAYSHEVMSTGFWPGNADADAFVYAYAYPVPDGLAEVDLGVHGARFDTDLGEFVMPYADLRRADDPADRLMRFLQAAYDAVADLAKWDRAALDAPLGQVGKPRKVGIV